MFKLIFFLIGLALAVIFSALNLGNRTDISFGFTLLKDIPVFFSISISFLAGALFTLPFAFSVSLSNKKNRKKKAEFMHDTAPDEFIPSDKKEFEKDNDAL